MAELVAVRAPTARLFLDAWDRVAQLGDAILPLDPHAPEATNAAIIRRMKPAAVVTTYPGRQDQLRTIRMPQAEPVRAGTAAVVMTSGSTGPAKGVVIPAGALDASTTTSLEHLACVEGEPWLLCLPWHHVAGLAVIRRSRALGVEPILLDRFTEAGVAHAIEEQGAKWVSLVPTQLRRLLDEGVPLDRLRGVLLGGAAADAALLAEAAERGVRVTTSYGMTETCGGCIYDGEPLRGTSASVLADGRIRLSGPTIAAGYRLDAHASADVFDRDAFTTNDLGRFDENGRLRVMGRADDVIVSGGENVPSGIVADTLRTHPAVEDAVVVGLPDDLWGHVVGAAVVLARRAQAPSLDDLRDHVGATLPRAWAPRRLVVVDAVPRTGLGKPDRRATAALFPAG